MRSAKRNFQVPKNRGKSGPQELSTGLRHYSKLVCGSVIILILVGSLVTSHGAGLAVPDWPTTYGENMFLFPFSKWQGNILYEHGHRLIASIVGLLTVILATWIALAEPRRWVKILAGVALAAVILQGILGGLTVIYLLPTPISVSHAMLAQTFLVLTIALAYSQSCELRERLDQGPRVAHPLFPYFILAFLSVYLQLFLGALMRHTESGLAIPDFPMIGGSFFPTFDSKMLSWINSARFERGLDPVVMSQVVIHFLHRAWALAISPALIVLGLGAAYHSHSDGKIRSAAAALIAVVALQFFLGVFTVLSGRSPLVASLHVVTGALLLGICALLVFRGYCAVPYGYAQRAASETDAVS